MIAAESPLEVSSLASRCKKHTMHFSSLSRLVLSLPQAATASTILHLQKLEANTIVECATIQSWYFASIAGKGSFLPGQSCCFIQPFTSFYFIPAAITYYRFDPELLQESWISASHSYSNSSANPWPNAILFRTMHPSICGVFDKPWGVWWANTLATAPRKVLSDVMAAHWFGLYQFDMPWVHWLVRPTHLVMFTHSVECSISFLIWWGFRSLKPLGKHVRYKARMHPQSTTTL